MVPFIRGDDGTVLLFARLGIGRVMGAPAWTATTGARVTAS